MQSSLSASDLHLENLTAEEFLNTSLNYGANDVATFSVTMPENGILPKGNYQATILEDAVHGTGGQPMVDDAEFGFFFLLADVAGANGSPPDRLVGMYDFNRLAEYMGQTGVGYSNGDFNYDGFVSISRTGTFLRPTTAQMWLPFRPPEPWVYQQAQAKTS